MSPATFTLTWHTGGTTVPALTVKSFDDVASECGTGHANPVAAEPHQNGRQGP